jgi:predicted CopG family antitoxin
MVIKSLTITENAYDALKKMKHGDESFSEVILRIASEKKGASAKFFGALKMPSSEAEAWQKRIHLEREKTVRESRKREERIRKSLS